MAGKKPYPIPFDAQGNLSGYPMGKDEWRPNEVFLATLHFQYIGRGRSSAVAVWQDITHNRRLEMFMTDLSDVIAQVGVVAGGHCTAHWTFQKRGMNYGVRLAKPDEIALDK